MTKHSILITNDDGPESPLLLPFLDSLRSCSWCDELNVVTPSEEQSWMAQAATRNRPLFSHPHRFASHKGFLVSGTPSDCLALGLENLFPKRPHVVFSGINLGANSGLAFYLSSGTVGAARQSFLFQVPAIAFSVKTPREVYRSWEDRDYIQLNQFKEKWKQVAQICTEIGYCLIEAQPWNIVDLFSVNIPWNVKADTRIQFTRLERTYYSSMFESRANNEYIHSLKGLVLGEDVSQEDSGKNQHKSDLPGDISTLNKEQISITPIRYNLDFQETAMLDNLKQALNKDKSSQ